jgi:hypothetical protein
MPEESETKVINIRTNPNWRKDGAVYIGRGSKWGNAYRIGNDGTRVEVIKKYREWFYGWLEDERFVAEVLELKGKTLACYCKPLACHGDIIAEFLDSFGGAVAKVGGDA